jgi:hypothetical protein
MKTFEEILGKGSKVSGEIVYPKDYIINLMKQVRQSTIFEISEKIATEFTENAPLSYMISEINKIDKNSIEIYE